MRRQSAFNFHMTTMSCLADPAITEKDISPHYAMQGLRLGTS